MKISTNWLKDFVALKPPLERIADALTMAGLEVKKMEPAGQVRDTVFEVEITTNRPDWLSHVGVAREIAAVENVSLRMPSPDTAPIRLLPAGWKMDIKDLEACPYYTGVYIEGMTSTQTPDFMKERLLACDLRPIHLIVDITNYVLLELGQPLHAFDADLIRGQEIQIRKAKQGEPLIIIDGSKITLDPHDLVIADHDRAMALAGVMGGKDSGINDQTRNLFLESAYFHPRGIRQSSKRYGISTDSSYRFERRVDPEGVDLGRERAIELIKQYAKPRFISGVLRAGRKPTTAKSRIHLSLSALEKTVGFKFKTHQVISILARLGLEVKQDSTESLNVSIPSFRSDLAKPIDLIEEVARIYGFDNIPEHLPARAPHPMQGMSRLKLDDKTREYFAGIGFHETVTFSLISSEGLDPETDLKKAVSIVNPLNKELTRMRPTLLPSLLSVIKKNHAAGEKRIPIFEVASVYSQQGNLPAEEKVLAVALSGYWKQKSWLDPTRTATFYDLKGIVESFFEKLGIHTYHFLSLEKSLLESPGTETIRIGDEAVGFLGKVASVLLQKWDLEDAVYYAEVSLAKLLRHVRWDRRFKEVPKYPSADRDLAVVVKDSERAGEIAEEIRKLGKGWIAAVEFFDLFQGGRIPKGFKNLAFRITYQSAERTLVSEEVQTLHTEIAETIVRKFQASFQ